jgi:hypothetical protein
MSPNAPVCDTSLLGSAAPEAEHHWGTIKLALVVKITPAQCMHSLLALCHFTGE